MRSAQRPRVYIILVVMLTGLLMFAACSGEDEPTPEPETATVAPTATPAATSTPTDVPEPTATEVTPPTVEPTAGPLPTPAERTGDSPLATPEGRSSASPLATPEDRSVESPLATPDATLAALVEAAKAQLAETVEGITVDDLEVVESEAVEWGDASLGCPEPDKAYAQIVSAGYRIVLAAGDERFIMHTTQNPNGRIVLCDEGQ